MVFTIKMTLSVTDSGELGLQTTVTSLRTVKAPLDGTHYHILDVGSLKTHVTLLHSLIFTSPALIPSHSVTDSDKKKETSKR